MKLKKSVKILIVIVAIMVLLAVGAWLLYNYFTGPVNAKNKDDIVVEIKSGSSVDDIAKILKEKKLIRSKEVFKLYVKLNKVKDLKADTYVLNQSMNLKEIVDTLQKMSKNNPNKLVLTFKEGKRITDYAKLIDEKTNNSYDDVINTINDKEYIKTLINKYWFLTDKILQEGIYYPLEGYLAPETYHFDNKDVKVKEIIETLLDQKEKQLEKYKDKISSDPHYYLTMASIVELEGTNTENRKMIVGVFKNRLDSNMNLGSDVTTYYGLQLAMTSDLTSEQFASSNAYNTRAANMRGKLPIGPICNVDDSSVDASVNPTDNDYLYFVADKNGKIYYSKTLDEHNRTIAKIKAEGNWIW